MPAPPAHRALLYLMKPFFQLLAVLGIILAGASVYFIATDLDNAGPDAMVRAVAPARLVPGTLPPGGGGTIPVTQAPFVWRTTEDMAYGTVSIGNNGAQVLITGKNSTFGTIAKLFSTAPPTIPTAPIPLWVDVVTLDSDYIWGAASETTNSFAVLRDVQVSPTDTFKRARLYVYTAAGLQWTHTFTNVQLPIQGNNYIYLKMASNGRIIVFLKDPSTTSLHVATFEPGSNTPQSGIITVSNGVLNQVDISRDGTRGIVTDFTNSTSYILNLTTRTLIHPISEVTQRIFCLSFSENGTKLLMGGFNYLKEYNWNGSSYVMETTYPLEGVLTSCSKVDLSANGTRAGFTTMLPTYQETTNRAFEVWSMDLSANTMTKHTTYVGTGSLYTQPTKTIINASGTQFVTGALGNNPPVVPQVHAYTIGQLAPLFEDLYDGSIRDMDFTPSGNYLATAMAYTAASPIDSVYTLYAALPSPNQAPWTAPHGINVTVNNRTTITLDRWNHAVNAQQYHVYMSTENTPCPGNVTPVITGNTHLTHTFTGLSPNTRYYFSIKGVNSFGDGPCSAIVIGKTPQADESNNTLVPPGPPSNLGIGNLTLGALRVTWSNPVPGVGQNPHTGIHIWRATTPGVPTTGTPHATVNSPTQVSYQDTQVVANTTYYYRVTAFNSGGDSAPSNEAFNTPQFPNCNGGVYNPANQLCELTLTVQHDDTIRSPTAGSWNTAWTATTGIVQTDTSYLKVAQLPGNGSQINTVYLTFDTASIPDSAVIASGHVSVYVESAYSTDSSPTVPFVNDKVYLLRANNASTPVGAGDYEQCGYPQTTTGGPILANEIDVSTVPDGLNVLTLTTSGTSFINKTGLTKLCLTTHQAYTGVQALPTPAVESSNVFIESREGNLAQAPTMVVRWAP